MALQKAEGNLAYQDNGCRDKTFILCRLTMLFFGWLKDSDNTFMYLKLQGGDVHEMESKMNSEVYIHKLGDEVSNDRLVLSKET
ncbi:MAG: hypothetical protein R2942_20075 [Ignavibacteria bacterium]